MPGAHAPKNPAPAADPLTAVSSAASAFSVFILFLVGAAGTLAFLSAQSAEPVILTLMGMLATLGVFFVFGLTAGHLRISERSPAMDLAAAMADQIDAACLLTAPDARILHANRTAARLMGRNELGDLNSLEEALAPTRTGAEVLFRLARAAQRGQPLTEELNLTRDPRDGRPVTGMLCYRISVKPFRNVDLPDYAGRAVFWTITDISHDRRESDHIRHTLEAELAHFTDIPAGVLEVDSDGRIAFMNPLLAEWLGFGPGRDGQAVVQPVRLADIVGRGDADLLASETGDQTGEQAGEQAGGSTASGRRLDIDFIDAAGQHWPATCVVRPADKSAPDSPMSVLVLARDAAPSQAVAGFDSDAALTSLFRTAPFGIALVGADGALTRANPAFTRLMGRLGAAGTCRAADHLARDADAVSRAAIEKALDAARNGKAEIAPLDIAVGEESEFARRIYFQAVPQPGEAAGTTIIYVTDATEERALGQKFAQSQKMEAVGKLAGGIAHDFNNVLTAIIGFSDLLLASHRPTDHAFKNIQNIRSSANHAAGLVKQLLAFSRRQTLEPEVLQLNELVTDLSVILNRLLGENVELKISSGRDLWAVKADLNQLNQVVINLAVNARDAMPDGGRLTVRTSNVTERESQRLTDQGMAVGQYVMVEVEDTGVGMAPDVMQKIFEPFFTTKDIGKGTGLGLSTVYGIIKQTGGYVFADSTVGEGTVFRVYLPRHVPAEDEKPEAARKPAKKERAADLTGHGKVLVVEDEDAVRIFATEALRRQGYNVLQACDGYEALDVMDEHDHQVDLVISDVKMPEMDGPTLFKELRAHNPDLKFVFVSGYADDAFTKKLDQDAVYKFLPKPYTLAQIAEVVKDQLG